MPYGKSNAAVHRQRWHTLQDVEILEQVGDNDYIVLTPAGIKCHALFNPFTDYLFADDVYRVVKEAQET